MHTSSTSPLNDSKKPMISNSCPSSANLPTQLLQGILLLGISVALIRWGGEGSKAVQNGLTLCFDVIIPAMFPFFILSNLTISLGLSHLLGKLCAPFMKPLFGLSGACATPLLLGLIGGYPVGAKTTVSLYQSKQCTKKEANCLLAFSNNAGPAFLLGVVATGMYNSALVGGILYGSHILSSLLVGLFFCRMTGFNEDSTLTSEHSADCHIKTTPFVTAFLKSVTDALQSTLNVCAFILCFTVLIRLFTLTGIANLFADLCAFILIPLGFPEEFSHPLVYGLLELTSGVTALPLNIGTVPQELAVISFFLAWGGLSVHCQTLALLEDLSGAHYLSGKLLQGIFSGIIAFSLTSLIFFIFPLSNQVATISTFGIDTEVKSLYTVFPLLIVFISFLLVRTTLKKYFLIF